MKKYISILCCICCGFLLGAQTIDSTKVFTEQSYLDWVKQYHPIIQRANLLTPIADAYRLKARGGFDPKVEGNIQKKSFDGKNYFTIGETGLKIPTWLGAEVKVGYNWANGIFLNPEENLPSSGQAFVGVTWALGKGLIIDERRAAIQKADLIASTNDATQMEMINNLLLEAGKAYWKWVKSYNEVRIYQQALDLSNVRLRGIRSSFLQGDKPAIDTLESLIQVQNRTMALQEVMVDYDNQSRMLSNFLWYENELPVEISDLLRPPFYEEINLLENDINIEHLINNLSDNHPTLLQYQFKLAQLTIDRQLKKEQLKPKVDLELNLLADGFNFVNEPEDFENSSLHSLLTENYKAGVYVSMPIFNRKAKGDLELVDLKVVDTNYQLRQKVQELKNKIINYQSLLLNSKQQVNINQSVVTNYESLLSAENEKFRFGESSIFLLNSREQKLISAQLKLVKLITVYRANRLALVWATGRLD